MFKCTCYVIGATLIAGAAHAQAYNPTYQSNQWAQPQQFGGYSNQNPSVRSPPPSTYYQQQVPGAPNNYLPPQRPGYQYAPGYPPGYRPQM